MVPKLVSISGDFSSCGVRYLIFSELCLYFTRIIILALLLSTGMILTKEIRQVTSRSAKHLFTHVKYYDECVHIYICHMVYMILDPQTGFRVASSTRN